MDQGGQVEVSVNGDFFHAVASVARLGVAA
jgi:hypothetical protein